MTAIVNLSVLAPPAADGSDGPLLDEPVAAWLHRQGEGAPRLGACAGSALGRAVHAAWPGARLVENTWA